jgi:hypothetical protein
MMLVALVVVAAFGGRGGRVGGRDRLAPRAAS